MFTDEVFLRLDTCAMYADTDGRAVKIFSTAEGLDSLSRHSTWCCDGTFHSAPTCFSQLFIIGFMVRK